MYNPVSAKKNFKGGNSFGREKRPSLGDPLSAKRPAPNHYRSDSKTTTLKMAPSYGFGTMKRPQTGNPRLNSPGPGAYHIKGVTGQES